MKNQVGDTVTLRNGHKCTITNVWGFSCGGWGILFEPFYISNSEMAGKIKSMNSIEWGKLTSGTEALNTLPSWLSAKYN